MNTKECLNKTVKEKGKKYVLGKIDYWDKECDVPRKICFKAMDIVIRQTRQDTLKEVREWLMYNECYCGKGDPLVYRFDKRFGIK